MAATGFDQYVQEHEALGAVAFREKHSTPMLVRLDLVEDDEEREFQTVFMAKRELTRKHTDEFAAPDPSDQLAPEEVFPIVKRAGGAFRERIGVGRTRNSDVCLPHSRVSKYHAYFSLEGGVWHLTDAGSKNGTYVGSTALEAKQPMQLENGIEVAFGPYRFRFYTADGFADLVADRAVFASRD